MMKQYASDEGLTHISLSFQRGLWKDRQDQYSYSLMNCSEIIAQLECFRLLC